MAIIIDPPNSVWPNGLKVDSEGYVTFYPLGTNKIDITTITWPDGDKLVSPFVYQNDKLVGFVDTEALTITDNTLIYLPYTHIEAQFSAIDKGQLQIHAPNATAKKASWKNSGVEDIPEVQFKYKGCKTIDDVKAVDANYQTTDIVNGANGVWLEPLWDLERGATGWWNKGMFSDCTKLKTFSSDLYSLTYAYCMFSNCTNLKSFSSNLSSLTDGSSMFTNCTNLTSFTSKLPSLTDGSYMFKECKLDTASVQNIADTINTYSGTIHIGIGNSSPNEQEKTAFNTIASKGWTVFVNGREYTPTTPAAITTLDENGEEQQTPIPYWAKPIQSDEKHARYVDAEGNFYNILGGNYIYGDDISTYGMFTCEEDAAANMRLTKIEKGDK